MAGIHELPLGRPVALANALGGVRGALDFADDVAGAAIDNFAQLAFAFFKLFRRDIAKRLHAEVAGGFLALRAAFGVFAAAQFVFDVRIDDQ